MLPPPFDGTTTHCPHALVHLVCLTRKPNLVNLERRETARRNLKVDLKCMCRTRNLRPGKETINTFFKRGLRKKPYLEVQEPRSTQLPDECMFGMSQRSILEIVQDWIVPKSLQKRNGRTCFRGSNAHEPSIPPTDPTPDPALEMVHCAPVAPSPR